jgi:hypothetical protein
MAKPIAALLAAALVVAGCGGGDSNSADVVRGFVDEYRVGDYNAACDRLSSGLTSLDLAGLAGADITSASTCPELLRQIAKRGNTPLDDDAVLDITSADESDVADSSTIETPVGTWTLQSSSEAPGGWEITGIPTAG